MSEKKAKGRKKHALWSFFECGLIYLKAKDILNYEHQSMMTETKMRRRGKF